MNGDEYIAENKKITVLPQLSEVALIFKIPTGCSLK